MVGSTTCPKPPPKECFLDLLERTISRKNEEIFATWYDKSKKPVNQYTYQDIWDEASIVAYELLTKYKLKKGDRVVLCYNFGLQFFAGFLGCLRAGVVAVLVYPPSPRNLCKALPKMSKVVEDSDAKLIIIDNDVKLLRLNVRYLSLWPQNITFMNHPKKRKLTFKNKEKAAAFLLNVKNLNKESNVVDNIKEDLAFLQYTSGSTGDPKGVMVTYGSLQSNVEFIIDGIHHDCKTSGFDYVAKDISVFSWLPQYHDMGLIYAVIAPFTAGWKCHMISPLTFIEDPLIWIDLMSRLQVTWSVAPNFAFKLIVRKFNEQKAKPRGIELVENLDLSSILYLQNASEPIQAETKVLFEETFGKYGLGQNWFMSGYGLAETVVSATYLHEYKLLERNATDGITTHPLIASGHRKLFTNEQVIKIVCPETHVELADGDIGEIWLSWPSVAAGYYGKLELTQEVFHSKIKGSDRTFLRTGDLAFFEDDYLYICGRQKDLIIVNGVNHYPQDIEHAVQGASLAVRPGCVAAFSSNDTGNDGDLEVVFEIRKEHAKNAAAIVSVIRTKIVEDIGLVPARVVAIRERSIHKTTSGKIQRKANRKALHDSKLDIIYEHHGTSSALAKDQTFLEAGSTSGNRLIGVADESEDQFDEIMISFFGSAHNPSKSWDELGLSSMTSVQMRDAITDNYAITLSPDCFDIYLTPAELKQFVHGSQGVPLEISKPKLAKLHSVQLSWFVMGCLQGLCSVFLLFQFAFSIVPAYYVGKWLANINAFSTIPALGREVDIVWIWAPMIVPTWMLGLSLSVIILKWVVIWKYREGILPIPSITYLRWWFVDRAVALWEFWVGRFIKDTPLINLFYFFMGANIHSSVVVDGFVREFDLVNIGEQTLLQHSINCHKFVKWDNFEGPSLRLISVNIGSSCVVKGMVSPGSSIGDGARVESLSVVPEAATVPEKVCVLGNPAFVNTKLNIFQSRMHENKYIYSLGVLKTIWLMIELYFFFGIVLLGQYLWFSYLPDNWRYTPVFGWFILIIWFSAVSTLSSVAMKWVIIGKRTEGPFSDSLRRTFADWAVDWHFGISINMLCVISSRSRVWNVVLWLHGMDIDSSSVVLATNFLPSMMDLVTIKRSFLSSPISIKIKGEKSYFSIDITNSSIGYRVSLDPEGYMQITNTIIPPLTRVTNSTKKDSKDNVRGLVEGFSMWELIKDESIHAVFCVLSCAILFCSLLPPYEIWMNCFGDPTSIWMAVPALASTLAVQTISWVALFAVWQAVALANSEESGKPWNKTLYKTYIDMSYNLQVFSFITALLGSPMYNVLVKFLGGKIDGYVILLPQEMYEFPYLSFENETIVEKSNILGHYVVYNDIALGPSQISGIIHEGNFAGNARVDGIIEKEPCYRAFVGSGRNKEISAGNNSDEPPGLAVGTDFTKTAPTNSSCQNDIFEENLKMDVNWADSNNVVSDKFDFSGIENGAIQEQRVMNSGHDNLSSEFRV